MRFPSLASAFLLFLALRASSETPPDATADVRAAVQKILDAQEKGDKAAAQAASDALAIPKLREWFEGAFTMKLPEDAQRMLKDDAATTWRSLALPYRVTKGNTIQDVKRATTVDEAPEGSAARVFLRLLKKPVPMYTITLVRMGKPEPFGCFFVLDGKVRFLADAYAEMLCDTQACKKVLKQFGAAIYAFEEKNKRFPVDLGEVTVKLEGGAAAECRFAPAGARAFTYVYPAGGYAAPPDNLLAFDPLVHPDDHRVVLFQGGRVDVLPEATFRKMLGDQLARDKAVIELRLKEAREGKVAAGEDAKKKVAALEAVQKLAAEMTPKK